MLGSEAPEIVYDGQYILHALIGGEPEDQSEFAKEAVGHIVEFLLSGRQLEHGSSPLLRRPYVHLPLADGTTWKMKKFN